MQLTKTSLGILLIISLLALVEQYYPGWPLHVWPLAAATWLFLLLCERSLLWLQKINLERQIEHHLFLGHSTRIVYHITNRDKHTLRIRTKDNLPSSLNSNNHMLTWNLCAHERQTKSITVTPDALGLAQFKNVYLSILGRLALAWWPRMLELHEMVKVIPAYRQTNNPSSFKSLPLLEANRLREYQSVTLVLNAGHLNQLVSNDLCRFYHYLNITMQLANRAIEMHRDLNMIIYSNKIQLVMNKLKTLSQLGTFFDHLANLVDDNDEVNHRCVIPHLEKIHQPGLLIWCAELDDDKRNLELSRVLTLFKPRFDIQVYSLMASETSLLEMELKKHARHPYHKLEILSMQRRWQNTRRLLQQKGIKVVAA